MEEQLLFVVADGIAADASSPEQVARVEAAARQAGTDFATAWPEIGTVEALGVGEYGGRAVVSVRVGSVNYIVEDAGHAQLVVSLVRVLQLVIAARGRAAWPSVPGVGPLTATVSRGRAIWALPEGAELAGIGRLFDLTHSNSAQSERTTP
ncbi:hypothetical protein [Microbacterium sp. NPDC055665]